MDLRDNLCQLSIISPILNVAINSQTISTNTPPRFPPPFQFILFLHLKKWQMIYYLNLMGMEDCLLWEILHKALAGKGGGNNMEQSQGSNSSKDWAKGAGQLDTELPKWPCRVEESLQSLIQSTADLYVMLRRTHNGLKKSVPQSGPGVRRSFQPKSKRATHTFIPPKIAMYLDSPNYDGVPITPMTFFWSSIQVVYILSQSFSNLVI